MADAAPVETIRQKARLGEGGKSVVFEPQKISEEGQDIKESVGKAKEALRSGQKASWDIDTHTLFEKAYSIIDETGSDKKMGVALTDDEVGVFTEVLDEFPESGVGYERAARGLRKDIAGMIVAVGEGDENAARNWQDLSDPKKAEQVRKNNLKMAVLYNYIKASGGDPTKLDWKLVSAYGKALTEGYESGKQISKTTLKALAEASSVGDKNDLYQKLLAREGYSDAKPKNSSDKRTWQGESQQERERQRQRGLDRLLNLRQPEATVDPVKFLKEEYYRLAMEPRLEAMRSPVSARLVGKGEDAYLTITRSRDIRKPKHEGDRVYASRLGKTILSSNTVMGRFLDDVHQGEYWRGKALLDYLYWRTYMGQLIDEKEAMNDETMSDIFARLDADDAFDAHFRGYTGVDALSKFVKDKDFARALNVLYTLPLYENNDLKKPLSFEQRLKVLANELGFDSAKDLPQSVTDAVMFSQVFALDAKHLSSSDHRYKFYFLAEYYHKQAAKVGGRIGEIWGGPGGILEVLGYNFKLTESPLLMMGFVPVMNLKDMDYHALVPDERDYDPVEYPDQLNKVWQNIDFYCLQQRDPTLRRRVPKGAKTVDYHVGVGEMGEYCVYDNNRQDHRAAVFKRLAAMYLEDNSLSKERGRGKAGWDKQFRLKILKTLKYLRASKDLNILGVQIKTNGREIFFDEHLERLLEEFDGDKRNVKYRPYRKDLISLLRMRNVLQDHRAWGTVWSLDMAEEEMFTRQEQRKDLMLGTLYNLAGKEGRNAVLDMINIAPFQSVYEINLTPAEVLERTRKAVSAGRFQTAQAWHTMYKIYTFASTIIEMRMSQMEVPSADSLEKTISPLDEVKFGVWGEERKARMTIEGEGVKAEQDHRYIYNLLRGNFNDERLNFSYLEHMSRLRLLMIENGFYRGWDEALAQMVERKLAYESLEWNEANFQFTLQNRGWLYEYLAAYLSPYQNQTVKSYEIPDVAIERDEKGRIVRVVKRQMAVRDVTMREAGSGDNGLYFEWISTEEAGEIFGGVRTARYTGHNALNVTESQEEGAKRLGVINSNQQIGIFEIRGDWCRIGYRQEFDQMMGTNQWIHRGWVRIENLGALTFEAQNIQGSVLPSETLFEGGRLVWLYNEKTETYHWSWEKGEWFADSLHNTVVFVKQGNTIIVDDTTEGKGRFVAIYAKGQRLPKDFSVKKVEGGFEKDGLKHKEAYYLPPDVDKIKREGREPTGDEVEQRFNNEARFPFMVWRTDRPESLMRPGTGGLTPEGVRKEFYEHRMRTIFMLQFGRTEGILSGGQAEIPLDRIHYAEQTAGDFTLIRGWYWLRTQMRAVERIRCARQMYQAYLKTMFHVVTRGQLYEGVTEALDAFVSAGRIWGEDLEVMENYRKTFPVEFIWQDKNPWLRLANTLFSANIPILLPKSLQPNGTGVIGAGAIFAGGVLVGGLSLLGPFAFPLSIGMTTLGSVVGAVAGTSAGRNWIAPAIYGAIKPKDPSLIQWYGSKHKEVLAVAKSHYKFRPVQ